MEARLIKELARDNENMIAMASMLCRNQMEIHRLQLMNIHSYPDTVGEIVYKNKGVLVTSIGDALMVKQCQVVLGFKVLWTQKLNNTCYMLFPIILASGSMKYLEFPTRRLFNTSHRINCRNRNNQTYIKDIYGSFWIYTLNKGFKKTKVKFEDYYQHHVPLPRLASFNSRLLHYSEVEPHRTTLLDILSKQRSNMQDLSDMRHPR